MQHPIKSLIQLDPAKAKKKILEAFKNAQCHRRDAAAALGVSIDSWLRWTRELELGDEFKAMEAKAKEKGWHHGRKGGAGTHKDPVARVKKTLRTRAEKK